MSYHSHHRHSLPGAPTYKPSSLLCCSVFIEEEEEGEKREKKKRVTLDTWGLLIF
jgi:hypothetical protein